MIAASGESGRHRGAAWMVLSVACFAVVNVIAKSLDRLPVHELVFFRSLISLSFCLWYVRRYRLNPAGNNRKWLILRGLFGLGALMLFFSTLRHMPLATATVIQYLSPLFTIYVASRWNNQQVKPAQWLYAVLAFAGILLMQGWDHRIEWRWLLAGVASSMLAGMAYNAIIKAKGTDHPMIIVMYFPLVALPFTGAMCLTDWVTPAGAEWPALLAMGALTQVAQYSTTMALHSDDASRVTPWTYFGAIFALVFGALFFGEIPELIALAGMALVVTGVLMNARSPAQSKRV
jgi:drug/metabolite transporter (DMT)-like permease